MIVNSAEESAAIVRRVLEGEKSAPRDIVLANAGGALWVGGVAGSPQEGVTKAAAEIDSGEAKRVLERLVAASNA
jgi:anthranilate phosphoribosyltransferase